MMTTSRASATSSAVDKGRSCCCSADYRCVESGRRQDYKEIPYHRHSHGHQIAPSSIYKSQTLWILSHWQRRKDGQTDGDSCAYCMILEWLPVRFLNSCSAAFPLLGTRQQNNKEPLSTQKTLLCIFSCANGTSLQQRADLNALESRQAPCNPVSSAVDQKCPDLHLCVDTTHCTDKNTIFLHVHCGHMCGASQVCNTTPSSQTQRSSCQM